MPQVDALPAFEVVIRMPVDYYGSRALATWKVRACPSEVSRRVYSGNSVLRMDGYGVSPLFYVPVNQGTYSIQVLCRHSGHTPYPFLRVYANSDVGLGSDLIAVAGAGSGWQVLSVSYGYTASGVVAVDFVVQSLHPLAWAEFDNLEVV